MSGRPSRVPSYRLHKASGQAVITTRGRDFYLGKHSTPASREAYDRRSALIIVQPEMIFRWCRQSC